MCVCVCVFVDDGSQVLLVMVQLSRSDFKPDDVRVVAYDSKLRMVARQEVTSSAGGMTSRREFTREFDVTRPVLRSTLRAVLQSRVNDDDECEGGVGAARLWVAGVISSSSVMSDEAGAAAAVSSVLPSDALPCRVDLR